MDKTLKRRNIKKHSIFTDLIVVSIVIILFVVVTSNINSNKENITEELSSMALDPFERNSILIDKIYDEFGVRIIYGQSSLQDAERVNAVVQEDEFVVLNNLEKIYNVFKLYPSKYFENNNLTIVLLDKFKNNNIALASRNSLEQYKIYITNAKLYERSLNHEMYHVFEYMLDSDYRKLIDKQWYGLNPSGFIYDSYLSNIDNSYVYSADGTSIEDAYFVSRYSKVTSKEDRAEIFAEMMRHDTEDQEYFKISCPIFLKANYVLSLLNQSYGHDINYKWSI